MLTGREDYARFQAPWNRQDKTYFRRRRNGTLQASKRHFASDETALRSLQNVLSSAASLLVSYRGKIDYLCRSLILGLLRKYFVVIVGVLCLCCSKTCPSTIFFAIVLSLSPSFWGWKSSGMPMHKGIEDMRGMRQIPLISVTYPVSVSALTPCRLF